jgi:hypothetical protein
VQPALDRWVRGEGSEEDLLRGVRWYHHWPLHFGHYRPIFQFARDKGAPMYGVNVEREVITSVRKDGIDKLPAADRAKLPPRIDLDNAEHRRLFVAYMGRSHAEMTPEMQEGMFRAQVAWDGVMGWGAVRALQAHPDPKAVVVVLLGIGHVAYGLGAQRQAALWSDLPAASVASVAAADEEGKPQTVQASLADFVWGAATAGDKVPLFPSLGVMLTDKPGAAGPTVAAVKPGSLAARAGLAPGDTVAAIDGTATPDKETTLLEMSRKAWGDKVTIEVVRKEKEGGQEKESKKSLTATLERDAAPAKPATSSAPAGPSP